MFWIPIRMFVQGEQKIQPNYFLRLVISPNKSWLNDYCNENKGVDFASCLAFFFCQDYKHIRIQVKLFPRTNTQLIRLAEETHPPNVDLDTKCTAQDSVLPKTHSKKASFFSKYLKCHQKFIRKVSINSDLSPIKLLSCSSAQAIPLSHFLAFPAANQEHGPISAVYQKQ